MTHKNEIGTGKTELIARIQSANYKFREFSRIFLNPAIRIKTKMYYFNSLIRSRLLYSCQNWDLTPRQFDLIDAAQRKLLRKMVKRGHC